jgi:hypothetical protein
VRNIEMKCRIRLGVVHLCALERTFLDVARAHAVRRLGDGDHWVDGVATEPCFLRVPSMSECINVRTASQLYLRSILTCWIQME